MYWTGIALTSLWFGATGFFELTKKSSGLGNHTTITLSCTFYLFAWCNEGVWCHHIIDSKQITVETLHCNVSFSKKYCNVSFQKKCL